VDQDIHLNPKLFLRSENFVNSHLPELFRAMGLKRVRAGGYFRILSCVLANLVKAGDRNVIVRMGKRVRYDGLSQKQLRKVIPAIVELDWVKLTKGEWRGDASTISRSGGLDLVGLGIVKEPKEILLVRQGGKLVKVEDYFSQEELGCRMAEMIDLNSFLDSANIQERGLDLSERELVRIYNMEEGVNIDRSDGDLKGFGRLYGASWINMKKEERGNITIEGELVAYLDFSAMNVRLAYFLAGEVPPPGDLYDVTGILHGYKNVAEWREPMKKFFSSIWFCKRHHWPKDVLFPGDTPKDRIFDRRFEYQDVLRTIQRKHPKLKIVLEWRQVGFHMARLESDIMVDILLRLKGLGIVGLPIHDGLLVKQSVVDQAGIVMDEVTLDRLGFSIPHKTELLYPIPENQWNIDLPVEFQ
jgi:hypothetical protein